eukprot:366474-Chlamydomonas_euryale.AAC.6
MSPITDFLNATPAQTALSPSARPRPTVPAPPPGQRAAALLPGAPSSPPPAAAAPLQGPPAAAPGPQAPAATVREVWTAWCTRGARAMREEYKPDTRPSPVSKP